MDSADYSETLVLIYQTTRRHMPGFPTAGCSEIFSEGLTTYDVGAVSSFLPDAD
jgi:hypothetical protein